MSLNYRIVQLSNDDNVACRRLDSGDYCAFVYMANETVEAVGGTEDEAKRNLLRLVAEIATSAAVAQCKAKCDRVKKVADAPAEEDQRDARIRELEAELKDARAKAAKAVADIRALLS